MSDSHSNQKVTISSRCIPFEKRCFKEICKNYNVSLAKGILLLIRSSIQTEKLPIEFDYEHQENLREKTILDSADILKIEDFIEQVRRGLFTKWDGCGYISDGKFEYYEVQFDVDWLTAQSKNFKYVCWYNK